MNQDQIIFAGSVLVLAVLIVVSLLKRAKQRRAHHWPSVVGHIESTGVTLSSGGGQPGAAAYYAELKYSYKIDGQSYQGALRRRFILKGRADKWIDGFAKSNSLTVRYNRENPGDSLVLDDDHVLPASA